MRVPYGKVVSLVPYTCPSTVNCTSVTPTLSVAFAERATALPPIVVPLPGSVMTTVGGVVSVGTVFFTVIERVVAVPWFPFASRAFAPSVYVPSGRSVVSQVMPYGETVSSPPRFCPSRVNWTPVTPTLSVAFAVTTTAEPRTVAPLAGAVRETVGDVVSCGCAATETVTL